jgi:hypothetical protein
VLTIAVAIFLRLSRVLLDEIPIAALLAFSAMLADFILVLLVAGMLIDTGTLQDIVAVLGGCR